MPLEVTFLRNPISIPAVSFISLNIFFTSLGSVRIRLPKNEGVKIFPPIPHFRQGDIYPPPPPLRTDYIAIPAI